MLATDAQMSIFICASVAIKIICGKEKNHLCIRCVEHFDKWYITCRSIWQKNICASVAI